MPLLDAYRNGDTAFQHQLLDEIEPLLFGMVRSLDPAGDLERSRRHANALTLAFHLDASAGRIAIETPNELRAYSHARASERLKDEDPLWLADSEQIADPATGSMVYKCLGLELTLEVELEPREIDALAARLRGEAADVPLEKLRGLGLVP